MSIARFVFQNPKTIFNKGIFYLPVKYVKYSDYEKANPILKNGKWDYPGGLQMVPRTRYLEFDVLGKIVSITTDIYTHEYTTEFMKKVGEYVYITVNISPLGYVSFNLTNEWDWFEYELSVKGSIVGRVDDIGESSTGRWNDKVIRIKGIFQSRYKSVHFPFEIEVKSNFSCLEKVLKNNRRVWGREVCWIECRSIAGFIKDEQTYFGSSNDIKTI